MSAVIEVARGWLGTPYVHQASCRGAGCDCLGLLRGIWREVHGAEPETVPAYTADWSEPSGEERLWAAAMRHLQPKPAGAAAVADVLLFRMCETGVAKHLGLQSATGHAARFIHAYSGRGVVETALTPPWARRVVARFAFPGRV
jgi:NlpC/P60 family putative phage cell wall peptidase